MINHQVTPLTTTNHDEFRARLVASQAPVDLRRDHPCTAAQATRLALAVLKMQKMKECWHETMSMNHLLKVLQP